MGNKTPSSTSKQYEASVVSKGMTNPVMYTTNPNTMSILNNHRIQESLNPRETTPSTAKTHDHMKRQSAKISPSTPSRCKISSESNVTITNKPRVNTPINPKQKKQKPVVPLPSREQSQNDQRDTAMTSKQPKNTIDTTSASSNVQNPQNIHIKWTSKTIQKEYASMPSAADVNYELQREKVGDMTEEGAANGMVDLDKMVSELKYNEMKCRVEDIDIKENDEIMVLDCGDKTVTAAVVKLNGHKLGELYHTDGIGAGSSDVADEFVKLLQKLLPDHVTSLALILPANHINFM